MSFTWAGLSNSQWVSYTAAQTSGITQLTALPTSDRWMTKSAAATYLNINTAYFSYATKSASQWVAKQDLHAAFANAGTLYYVNFDVGHNGSYGGWSSAALACAHSGALTRTVYWNGTLGNGTLLYEANGTTVSAANTTDSFYMNGYSFTSSTSSSANQFTVANYSTCSSTSTVTVYVKRSLGSGGYLWWSSNGGTTWNYTSNSSPNAGCNQVALNVIVPASTSIMWVLSNGTGANDPAVNGWYPTTGASGAGTCPAQTTTCGASFASTSPLAGGSTTISITSYTNNPPC